MLRGSRPLRPNPSQLRRLLKPAHSLGFCRYLTPNVRCSRSTAPAFLASILRRSSQAIIHRVQPPIRPITSDFGFQGLISWSTSDAPARPRVAPSDDDARPPAHAAHARAQITILLPVMVVRTPLSSAVRRSMWLRLLPNSQQSQRKSPCPFR